MDVFLEWIEGQKSEITYATVRANPCMLDLDPVKVAKQLWALLSTITRASNDMTLVFKNVERHKGAEAYRRLVEPIYASQEERRAEYQKRSLQPRKAKQVGEIGRCIEEWETDYRHFLENGGLAVSDESRRNLLIEILQADVEFQVRLH